MRLLDSSSGNTGIAYGMIAAARQFEMQMKMLQTAEGNEQRAAKLLSPAG
jgi:flagellar basal body rod protein FlgF